jgi:adenine-specific DNA methylase
MSCVQMSEFLSEITTVDFIRYVFRKGFQTTCGLCVGAEDL